MSPLLERCAGYITPRQIATWQRRIAELRKKHEGKQSGIRSDGRLNVSMFGIIRAYRQGEEPQRFQGGRVRQLIGMMVAGRMLDEPLSPAEFARLVAGNETADIENARNILKNTVHRLRESIGHDAVLTDGDLPRLNPERVRVDLLEAYELLKKARKGIRRGSPMQARVPLVKALEIAGGEVPFPSLYDDFIEAVREDFENELRSVAIDVARALTTEGGVDDAAEVLRLACRAIPGDEELAELLREALVKSGHRAEAERVKMKSEVVE
jgi:hypothetical protein